MATSADSASPTAVFQLRANPQLLQQVKDMAAQRRVSANRYVVDAVKARLTAEKEREWREGFEAMGRDPDTDVEYMIPAAREVLFGR